MRRSECVIRDTVFVIIALIILLAVHQPSAVSAADLEITPFMGYTFGGDFESYLTAADFEVDESESYGIILGVTDPKGTQYEFIYSHQPTTLMIDGGALVGTPLFDLDIDYFQVGGTFGNESAKVKPYVAGGLGVTYLDPEIGDSETRFSLSFGGGIKVLLSDRVGIRFEGRGFGTFIEGNGAVFCSNGNCAVGMSGDVFWQFSAFSGVTMAF